jgi:NhaA family Na+:H+ antiporter
VIEPVVRFLHVQSASGAVLLAFTLAALVLANSALADRFLDFWKTPIGVSVGSFEFRHSLKHWINDGLMVIFFFVVGLEVKRELALGELRDLRLAALPIAAALGGMIAPGGLYLAMQWGEPGQRGWGIPMATDIAFVVGCLAVLGHRVPHSLRVLLLSLAIADDVGAILVIAIGYTSGIHIAPLVGGLAGIVLVMLLARVGVRSILVYVLLGIAIWFGFHESGVHATLAGVVLGLLTPVRPWLSTVWLVEFFEQVRPYFGGDGTDEQAVDRPQPPRDQQAVLRSVGHLAAETISPLERLEASLHPWVSFVILPLFALANAGVAIRLESLTHPTALAVMVGLVVGKPLGIVLLSFLAVRAGLARLPEGVNWNLLTAGGVLAGIGFTMSLFIAGLALEATLLDAAKVGILSASALCAAAGLSLLVWLLPKASRP